MDEGSEHRKPRDASASGHDGIYGRVLCTENFTDKYV